MKWAIIISLVFVAIALAATRVYDIEPFQNCNGKAREIGQIFVATCDSFLWVDFFVGAPNDTSNDGHYDVEIQEYPNGLWVVRGRAEAGKSYEYTPAIFNVRNPNAKVLKGKQYLLKVTHSNGDSINFYYNPNNLYPYGLIYDPPPPAANSDLAARIEGITRIPQDLFGTEIGMSFSSFEDTAGC
jgi:hypothetical protein